MPVVQITTFQMKSQEKAEELMREVTAAVHRVTAIPLDKISVYLSEVSPARWSDAGVVGSSHDFAKKSRRISYEESSEL